MGVVDKDLAASKLWVRMHQGFVTSAIAILRRVVRLVIRSDGPDLWALSRGGLVAGDNLSVETGCILDPSFPWLISIGDDCTLSTNVVVYAHDAALKRLSGYSRVAPVRIGNGVYIGSNCVVLPGTTIGDGAIVGAGSVVTRDVPAGTVVAGSPARTLGSVDDLLQRHLRLQTDGHCWAREHNRPVSPGARKAILDALERGDPAYIE